MYSPVACRPTSRLVPRITGQRVLRTRLKPRRPDGMAADAGSQAFALYGGSCTPRTGLVHCSRATLPVTGRDYSGHRGRCPLPPVSAGDVRRVDRPVPGDRSAAHRPAHRPGQPRLSLQWTAWMRQDHVSPHPGPLPQLRRGPDRHPVRHVPVVRRAQPRRRRIARRRRDRRREPRWRRRCPRPARACRLRPGPRPLQDLHRRRGAHGHLAAASTRCSRSSKSRRST